MRWWSARTRDTLYREWKDNESPLRTLFSSPMGYSYTAFQQAALLCEEIDDQDFEIICRDVAAGVTMNSEFISLLQLIANHEHIGAIVITCGLSRI
jgi:hypothetical protein